MHVLFHWLGMDDGSGPQYLFLSGFAGDLIYLGALAALYRHVNCHVDTCKRIGGHHVAGTPFRVCRRHHPTGGNTVESIHEAHESAKKA